MFPDNTVENAARRQDILADSVSAAVDLMYILARDGPGTPSPSEQHYPLHLGYFRGTPDLHSRSQISHAHAKVRPRMRLGLQRSDERSLVHNATVTPRLIPPRSC